jgi:FMN reductase
MSAAKSRPFIIGIGGTATAGSSTEQALKLALASAERAGAEVRIFDGPFIASLPHYARRAANWSRRCGMPMA